MTSDSYCLNCRSALAGRWCQSCGQKRLEPQDRTVIRLLGEFVSELTNLDGRVLRSFSWLIIRPGQLAYDYLRGARKRHLSPIALFLLANVAFFFAPPLSDFTPSLREHISIQAHSTVANALVKEWLTATGLEFAEFEKRFEQRQNDFAKTLLFLHMPLLAIGLLALHFRRRLLFADHVLVAFYLMAFMLLHSLITPRILGVLIDVGVANQNISSWASPIGLIGPLLIWLGFLLRGAYSQPAWLAAVKVPLVFAVLAVAHLLYRAVLFFIVFAAV